MMMFSVINNKIRPNAKIQHETVDNRTHKLSSTLIDLIFVRNTSNILTSAVIDTFTPNQIRYNCPTVVTMKLIRPQNKTFKREVLNFKLANFERYREILADYNLKEK